jgi:hypothetical protein
MSKKDDRYPQDISPDESDLKFQRLLIEGFGAWKEGRMSAKPVPVVARILSPSDVLVKVWDPTGLVRYAHWRSGYSKSVGSRKNCHWHSLSTPTADASQLICDFSFQAHEERCPNDVIGVPFEYQAV